MLKLVSLYDDALDVYRGDYRVGTIQLMIDGWAVYLPRQTKRIGTYTSIALALDALKEAIS